jgi:hypothetical protein
MKKILLIISIFALTTFGVYADIGGASVGSASTGAYAKVGMSGGQFLKIGHGARINAMAGAGSALVDDMSSIYWNPAGIADLPSLTAEFDYTNWFAGLNHNFAAVGLPFGDNFALAVHFTSLSTDEMERTTLERPDGTNSFFTASDVGIGVTFAGYLTDNFSFGITGRYLNNNIAEASANGFEFDVGTKYRTGIQGIVLGVSLHGVTTELTYAGNEFSTTMKYNEALWSSPVDVNYVASSFDIPLVFRADIAADIYKSEDHYLVGAFDFTTTSDSPEQFALGAEYTWRNLLAVRAGYRLGQDIQGFSGGIGIRYLTGSFSGMIDYSISPLSYNLGLVNRVSVTLDLGRNNTD